MKNLILFSLKSLFIGINLFITTISFAQWQYVGSPETGSALNFAGTSDSLFLCAGAGLFFSKDEGNSWSEVNIPDTVGILYLVRYEKGVLYLITIEKDDSVGSNIIFRSTDMGATWIDITPIRDSWNSVISFVVKIDTLVAVYKDRIAISFDRGLTYEVNPFSYLHLTDIVIKNKLLFSIHRNLILKSNDFGITWDTSYVLPPSSVFAGLVLIDDVMWNVQTYFNSDSVQIRKSTDDGLTWEFVKRVTLPDETNFVYLIGEAGNLFLYDGVSFNGHLNSIDTGKTWSWENNNERLFNLYYTNQLLFGFDDIRVRKSVDNGKEYATIQNGFLAADVSRVVHSDKRTYAQSYRRVHQKNVDALFWEYRPYEQIAQTSDGHLYAAVGALQHSFDGGDSWLTVTSSVLGGATQTHLQRLYTTGEFVYLAGLGQTWYSNDIATSWHKLVDPDLDDTFIDMVSGHNGKYVATTWNEKILPSDDGINWDNITFDFPELDSYSSLDAFAIWHHHGSTYLYMNHFFGKLPDGETHWQQVIHPVPSDESVLIGNPIHFILSSGNTLIAGVYAYGIYISDDSGQTWQPANLGLEDFQVNSGVIIGQDLYIGVKGGVWRRPLSELGTTSISEQGKTLACSVSPSPVIDILNVRIEDPEIAGEIQLTLFDSKGSIIKSHIFSFNSDIRLDVSDITAGIYLLRILVDHHIETIKVIKI